MSETPLPRVSAAVLTEAVDGLPGRLRKKLDDTGARAAAWPVTVTDGGEYAIVVDEAVTVTLTPVDGVVRTAGAARCSCLLAPNCLHRAALLARAPVDDDTGEPPVESAAGPARPLTVEPEPVPGTVEPEPVPGLDSAPELTAAQRAAAQTMWQAGAAVLESGAGTAGTLARTALLRAAHEAQAAGAYRAAAAARRVAAELQAWPHGRLADLAGALTELLGVSWQLRRQPAGAVPGETLLGSARRRYQPQGSLRLYGLFSTAVLASSGHAGVISYLAGADGTLWSVADIAPGDAGRASSAGNATVRLGEAGLTHRALARTGLIVSGATASAARQLGAGAAVRAVTAPGASWSQEPLAALWRQPLAEQVHRAFAALALPVTDRPAGTDLLFLAVRTITGSSGDALRAVTDDGQPLWLSSPISDPALPYRDNLQVLARTPGLAMLVIARPDRSRPATVHPLAIAPGPAPSVTVPGGTTTEEAQADAGWALSEPFTGHVDLAFDRLHASHFARTARAASAADFAPETSESTGTNLFPGPAEPPPSPYGSAQPAADPVLHLLRAAVERALAGGRAVLAVTPQGYRSDTHRLRRARLSTGAQVLDRLITAATARPRDPFGRLTADGEGTFAQAWLGAAAYLAAATGVFAESSWLPVTPSDAQL
jgi:hypothetical protein